MISSGWLSTRYLSREGPMTSSHNAFHSRNHQKSQALRMLLTSGVIRSAIVDPPSLANPRLQISSPRVLCPDKPVYARLPHATDHVRPINVLAHWCSAFVDILRTFGRR